MHLAQHIETHIHTSDAADTVTLDYEARFLRRKRLVSDGGEPFLVELAETQSLNPVSYTHLTLPTIYSV